MARMLPISQEPPHGRPLAVTSADGTVLHAVVHGPEEAQTIVLVHGISCSTQLWVHQILGLADQYRVITYDQRGHGRSQSADRRGSFTLQTLSDDLAAVLEAGLPDGQQALVVGHSMGGIAVTAWAQHYPEQVSQRAAAAVLINTTQGRILHGLATPRIPTGFLRAGLRTGWRAGGARVLHTALRAPVVRASLARSALGDNPSEATVELLGEVLGSASRIGRAGYADMLMDLDHHIPVSGLVIPTMVIGGTHDRIAPIVESRRLAAEIPHLHQLVELDGVGHVALLEAPDTITEHLRDLARLCEEANGSRDADGHRRSGTN